ncbi:lantibiotic dehydratase [Streptomyces fagopyri]|uniref:lantibiotic dehydratase n=1 Tax=Streptomyces fagopyri TaxID=2662397 RepID=UPI003712AF0D
MNGHPIYQALDFGMLRMPLFPVRNELPDIGAVAVEEATDVELRAFLSAVHRHPVLCEAVALASPALGDLLGRVARGEQLRRGHLRKAAVSATRYVIRAGTRSTPFGLFAGVAPVAFGESASVRVGPDHVKHGRPGGAWLAGLLSSLERRPEVLRALDLVTNDALVAKGGGLHVPLQSASGWRSGALASGRVVVRAQPFVLEAVAAARRPIGFGDLRDRLSDAFPDVAVSRVEDALARLVRSGVLLTSLRPPLDADPLDHLRRQLAGLPGLRIVEPLRAAFADYGRTPVGQGYPALRSAVEPVGSADTSGAVQVDLRCDAQVVLPRTVAAEAARAVSLLWRIAPPEGRQHAVLRDYRDRFTERYGHEALIPLGELLDPERGLGAPEWRPALADLADGRGSDTPGALRARAAVLAELAWPDGTYTCEVELTPELADRLTRSSPESPTPTTEVVCEVLATDVDAVERGDFRLVVRGGSAQAGALFGRFGHVLPELEDALKDAVAAGVPEGSTPAQLFFQAPGGLAYSVAGTPRLVERVVSVGEFRSGAGADVLRADDLAVGVHEDGLYLASARTGQEIHLVNLNVLNPRMATAAEARFLRELMLDSGRKWAEWAWGPLARTPRLPRVRYGHTILVPERWRPSRAMQNEVGDWQRWKPAFEAWRVACEVPRNVQVGGLSDHRLALDLDRPAHQRLLWDELRRRPLSFVEESLAPAGSATGWSGGHCTELVIPMRACAAPAARRTTKPRAVTVPVVHPLAGEWLFARIDASPHLHDEILADHLPPLISALGDSVDRWFFFRYDDPSAHLRLRLHGVPDKLRSTAVPLLSDWAQELGRLGLAGGCELHPYRPETARYGGSETFAEAEAVFQADSEVVLTQLSLSRAKALGPDRQLMTALNLVAMVRGMLPQDWAGWLLRAIPRDCYREAFRNRRGELRALVELGGDVARQCGGDLLAAAWLRRDRDLSRYARALERQPSGPASGDPLDRALRSLMHTHHIRAVGIDRPSEGAAYALARGVAELTLAPRGGVRP